MKFKKGDRAKYDGCLSFGGHKLMLLKGDWNHEDLKTLDPHFLDETMQ